jgi:hypothetical protein
MRILRLTSPPMHGDDVLVLQRALNRNHFGDFLPGTVTDIYDLHAAQAVYRAKYWLGYLHPNREAGQQLVDYLHRTTPLTSYMLQRRKARLAAQAEAPLRLKALEKMKTYVGIHGLPNAITNWWGWAAPWCAMTVSRAYAEAGSTAFRRGLRWACVGDIDANARLGNWGLSLTREPKPGDLVIFDWPGTGSPHDHVGMVVSTSPLITIEGNTSSEAGGSQYNGGQCCRKDREAERRAGLVRCYVHVSK